MTLEYLSAVRFGYTTLKDVYKYASKYVSAPQPGQHDYLSQHLTFALNWSNTIDMFGMAHPLAVESNSISLTLSSTPRKFSITKSNNQPLSENDVITDEYSAAILGDPGSGKTTTIKRMIRKVILEEPINEHDTYQFPILSLGRRLTAQNTIFDDIFSKIGFSLNDINQILDKREKKDLVNSQKEEIKKSVLFVLENAKVLIIIDGIDEISDEYRRIFDRDIEDISNGMKYGKVIVTCRSGDWTRSISGFKAYEICSLSNNEIKDIINIWVDDPDNFMTAIENIPYKDILDRPLFLTMLAVIFNQTKLLPEHPVDVYHRITNLLLEKWDLQRDIVRPSKYSGFLVERKYKFLAAIAYELIKKDIRRFSSGDIKDIILRISENFEIPSEQFDKIAAEIESHTGIIVEAGFEKYEFCHLTVQEFLAAVHLVTIPDKKSSVDLLQKSPSTVAVAACLSSDVGQYFSYLVTAIFHEYTDGAQLKRYAVFRLKPFLARFRIESPIVVTSKELGVVTVLLLNLYDSICFDLGTTAVDRSNIEDIVWWIKIESVKKSILSITERIRVRSSRREDGSMYIELMSEGALDHERGMELVFSPEMIIFFKRNSILDNVVKAAGI